MEPPDFTEPNPDPIDGISPSRANELLSCPLKAAFGGDWRFKEWSRPSTFSVLGDAAHAVTEVAYTQQDWPDDGNELRAALEEAWNTEIEAGARKLAQAWAPASPPPPEAWPAFQLTRARTIRRAARHIPSRGPTSGSSPGRSGTGIEKKLADPRSGLHGRVDRIERHGDALRVVDLKTGLNQAEPSADQIRQVQLYAVLVQRESGEWPTEIAIENASGEQLAMTLDASEAEAAADEVLAAVEAFNQQFPGGKFSSLAQPDADTCRWCPYRVLCGPYWDQLQVDWGHRSLLGKITDSTTADQGAVVNALRIGPHDHPLESFHLASLPEPPAPEATWIAAVDIHVSPDLRDTRAKWSSRIRTW